MSFIKKRGKTKSIWLPVTTSQVFTKDSIVEFTSGLLAPADAGEAAIDLVGIIRKTIAATDSDYATSRLVPIEVPVEKHVEYIADFNSGLLSTDLGTEYDLADAVTVDHAATTDKCFKVIGYISATKGIVFIKFNGSY